MNKCDRCDRRKATMILRDEHQEKLCFKCYNDMASKELGIKLEDMPEEFTVYDFYGTRRTFTNQQRLYPNGIFLEAVEDIEFGYKFSVHGDLDCNQTGLFQQLVDKVKSGVFKQFVKQEVFPSGQTYHSIKDKEVVGYIDHDEKSQLLPMIVIDGKPYTREQLGEMVMSHEGAQFKMKFFDMTEEVE